MIGAEAEATIDGARRSTQPGSASLFPLIKIKVKERPFSHSKKSIQTATVVSLLLFSLSLPITLRYSLFLEAAARAAINGRSLK